jgi:histidinol phosphatase-like PHP family hydrolase
MSCVLLALQQQSCFNINKNEFFQIRKPAYYWNRLKLVMPHFSLKIRNGIECRERNPDHRHTMKQMRFTTNNNDLIGSVNQAKENLWQFVAEYRNQHLKLSQNILTHV